MIEQMMKQKTIMQLLQPGSCISLGLPLIQMGSMMKLHEVYEDQHDSRDVEDGVVFSEMDTVSRTSLVAPSLKRSLASHDGHRKLPIEAKKTNKP
jgi:hypothetical protein